MRIKRVDNGAIVHFEKYEYEDNVVPVDIIYKFNEDDLEDLKTLLFDVMESLNGPNDKWKERVLVVQYEHGGKFECTRKKCVICGRGITDAGP